MVSHKEIHVKDDLVETTLWYYASPGDRETLATAGIAWLLDPAGNHGHGRSVIDFLLRRCGIDSTPGSHLHVDVQDSPSRDRRFDIAIFENNTRNVVVELKCKTFGTREQLERYAASQEQPHVVRVGYGEWNWPTLNDSDRRRFPLVTLSDIADFVFSDTGTRKSLLAQEFVTALRSDADYLNGLHAFFCTEEQDTLPSQPQSIRYSQRFLNCLYWEWFKTRAMKQYPDVTWEFRTKSEISGVWTLPLYFPLPEGTTHRLEYFDIEIEGPLDYWLHLELGNKTGLRAGLDEVVGKAELRIGGDDFGTRTRLWNALSSGSSRAVTEGWRLPGKRPGSGWYWYAFRKDLPLRQFRFGALCDVIFGTGLHTHG